MRYVCHNPRGYCHPKLVPSPLQRTQFVKEEDNVDVDVDVIFDIRRRDVYDNTPRVTEMGFLRIEG